jgi:hypothetical protein
MPVIINGTDGINVASTTGVINLLGSTSGAVTIAAPAVAGTNTLTLPALTGTLITDKTVGTVLQVVNVTYGVLTTTSSSTFITTGLTASITPKFSTSKILVMVSQNGVGKSTNDMTVQIKLQRNSSDILVLSGQAAYTQTAAYNNIGSVSGEFLDSPATTSSVTYRTVFAAFSPAAVAFVQSDVGIQSVSTITLMEIAA